MNAINKGAASSFTLNAYSKRIIEGDNRPGFYVKHFVKDMGMAIREARTMGL